MCAFSANTWRFQIGIKSNLFNTLIQREKFIYSTREVSIVTPLKVTENIESPYTVTRPFPKSTSQTGRIPLCQWVSARRCALLKRWRCITRRRMVGAVNKQKEKEQRNITPVQLTGMQIHVAKVSTNCAKQIEMQSECRVHTHGVWFKLRGRDSDSQYIRGHVRHVKKCMV